MQYNRIPKIGKVFQLGIFWMIPIVAYLGCMYCVAFNEVSLVISIFAMGVMLHPLIAIPLAQCSKMFCKIAHDLCIKKFKNKFNTKTCSLSMSIILYMGLISLNQMYLFSMWVRFREDKINENCKI